MEETVEMNHIPTLRGWRAEVGMLAPLSWMYREWEVVAPKGIRFSTAVMGFETHTAEVLKGLLNAVETEAKKLNQGRKCDLICFGCTSGSFIGGVGYDQMLIKKIEGVSGSPATTTSTCVLEIFKDMGVKKIALVGPYPDSTFEEEVKFLKENGVETLYWKGLGLIEMPDYWEFSMDPYSCCKLVKEGAKAAPDADCIFASCMISPILGVVDYLEKEVGKLVISSLSATLYGILKKLGIPDPVYHYGEALVRPRIQKRL
jgi:maleate isomerase